MPRKTDVTDAQRADALFELRALARVAESGSMSAAARALGVQVSTVTRAVQRVEERLGVHLFVRSTHGVAATEAGRAYAAHVAHWLAAEDALRDELAAMRGAGRGTLRVTMPVFVAERILPAVAARFLREQPDARLDVHASDDVRDVVREAFDLAIRMGPLPDSTLRGRRVASFRRVVCAAPALLAAHRAPREPAALAELPCLLYGSGASAVAWTFRKATGERARVEVHGPVRSNNLELLVALAEAGLGVAWLPDWAVRESIARGRLARLLAAWSHEPERARPALYAVHAADPGKERLRRSFLAALEDATRRGGIDPA
ncbi:MAG: LysR family transcriptional regulator [Proteobacteria bacterium]|nr:MAG: LysR family transcriptional regulator [Pseudomonadota bacterium]